MSHTQAYRERRAALILAGVTTAQIAAAEKVSKVYVWQTLTGERTGYRIRRAIAKACGVPVEALWPNTPEQHRRAA